MRIVLFATVIGLLGPLAAEAQESAPTTPPQQAPAAGGNGQTEAAGDRTKTDDTGATGWGGSWSANEGQRDDAQTPTTQQAKPLPPIPSAPPN